MLDIWVIHFQNTYATILPQRPCMLLYQTERAKRNVLKAVYPDDRTKSGILLQTNDRVAKTVT